MNLLVTLLTFINTITNVLGRLFFAPIAVVPGWLSITIISAVIGILLLLIFKYTSNQNAIAGIRNSINANLLAIKLFRDNIAVTFKSLGCISLNSLKLLLLGIVPMLIMIVPVSLILAQMGTWYQARPLNSNDEPALVKLKLNDNLETWPQVKIKNTPAVRKIMGPVRVISKKEIYWKIQPVKKGYHQLVFQIDEKLYEKQLAIGDRFMRLSSKRPGANLSDILLHPLEKPFHSSSIIHSIQINYPERKSRIYGSNWWILYFFIVSMVFAFLIKPIFKVKI